MNEKTTHAGELTDAQIIALSDDFLSAGAHEYVFGAVAFARAAIAADRALRASPAIEGCAAESVNDTNAILATQYFEVLKKLEVYEKNGVTCQTYRHFVDAPCAECNVVAALTAERDALRKDAERYRWLEENTSHEKINISWEGPLSGFGYTLSEAIDAAMTKNAASPAT